MFRRVITFVARCINGDTVNFSPWYAFMARKIITMTRSIKSTFERSHPRKGIYDRRNPVIHKRKIPNDCLAWKRVKSVFSLRIIGRKKMIYESAHDTFSCHVIVIFSIDENKYSILVFSLLVLLIHYESRQHYCDVGFIAVHDVLYA